MFIIPFRHVVRSLGEGGELEPETAAILAANDIEDSILPNDTVTELGIVLPWDLPEVRCGLLVDGLLVVRWLIS